MNLRQYSPIWNLILIVLVMYGVHQTAFYFFSIHTEYFYYSLETVYLFFLLSALVVFIIVLKIKERNFDQIGMTFMLLTSIKTVFSYIMLRPVLKLVPPESPIEKNNFFMTFVVFLLIETLLTIRILNQKGQNSK